MSINTENIYLKKSEVFSSWTMFLLAQILGDLKETCLQALSKEKASFSDISPWGVGEMSQQASSLFLSLFVIFSLFPLTYITKYSSFSALNQIRIQPIKTLEIEATEKKVSEPSSTKFIPICG
jgi:hypothetical protein